MRNADDLCLANLSLECTLWIIFVAQKYMPYAWPLHKCSVHCPVLWWVNDALLHFLITFSGED